MEIPVEYEENSSSSVWQQTGRSSPIVHEQWSLNGQQLQIVSSYKYLGVDMNQQLSFTDMKKRMALKAKQNMMKCNGMGIQSGLLPVKAAVNVWQALVRSVLEYGAEIWSEEKWEEAERIQVKMGKMILKCSKSHSGYGSERRARMVDHGSSTCNAATTILGSTHPNE